MVSGASSGGKNIFEVGLRWLGSGKADTPGGGGRPTGPGGGREIVDKAKEVKRDKLSTEGIQSMVKTGKEHFRSTFGINVGVAAILKQSQIFTGTVGTLFQILGAFIDVILAAFMPIIVPALVLLARLIPYIRKAAENTVGRLIDIWITIKNFLGKFNILPKQITSGMKEALMHVMAYFFLGTFLARITGMQAKWWQLWRLILINPLLKLIGIAITWLKIGATGGGGGGGTTAFAGGGSRAARGLRGPGAAAARRAAAQASTTAGAAGAVSRFGPLGAGVVKRLPGIAIAMGAITAASEIAQGNIGRGIGRGGGMVAGGLAGAKLGAMALAPLGPAGMAVGAIGGGIAGALLGDKYMGDLGDALERVIRNMIRNEASNSSSGRNDGMNWKGIAMSAFGGEIRPLPFF